MDCWIDFHFLTSFHLLQHIKDKFWNYIFYKFIFIFGVINAQKLDEVMLWCAWFTLLGFFHLFTQLCQDRFQYVSVLTSIVIGTVFNNQTSKTVHSHQLETTVVLELR